MSNFDSFFIAKIRYEKVMENGMQKKVTEQYLVSALSFTEAEARIIEKMTPYITGEFTVCGVVPKKYSELFTSTDADADRYYVCKLNFITLDEKSGAEKKTTTQVLVQASDLRDAVKRLDAGMKGTLADYQIVGVDESPILDFFPYDPGEEPIKEDAQKATKEDEQKVVEEDAQKATKEYTQKATKEYTEMPADKQTENVGKDASSMTAEQQAVERLRDGAALIRMIDEIR